MSSRLAQHGVPRNGLEMQTRKPMCSLPECAKVAITRGYCQNHYRRWRLYGDPRVNLLVKHGNRRRDNESPEYSTWMNIIGRCTNPKSPSFKYYGGRGIRICPRWRESFGAFLSDMGRKPSPTHSIDRINNDGDYEPGNARWVSRKVQARNQRSNTILRVNGLALPLAEWADRVGINANTISCRLYKGWSAEKSVLTPVKAK